MKQYVNMGNLLRFIAVGILSFPVAFPLPVAGQIILSEIMADNDSTLQDEDGTYSDWIELYNPGGETVDLTGWYLTDDDEDFKKWRFPSIRIEPHKYLLIYASGKDQAVEGLQLHSNFQLSKAGEYLALVHSDGMTIEDSFSPSYPKQLEDLSYGRGQKQVEEVYVDSESAVKVRVPAGESPGAEWQSFSWDDSAWLSGFPGVGYDNASTYLSHLGLDVKNEMYQQNTTVYVRIPFQVEDPAALRALTLRMKYDDGFVAYLNGVQVAAVNAPSSLKWDSEATGPHDDNAALVFEDFDITNHISALREGNNLLAIHGLNRGARSSDFLLFPELRAHREDVSITETGTLSSPTPGDVNAELRFTPAPPVFFSMAGGMYSDRIEVELSSEASVIYYTVDGSVPDVTSEVYTLPVSVSGTTQIRARSFEAGLALGPVHTETYLFADADTESFSSNLPLVVIDNLGAGSTIPDADRQGAYWAFFEPGADGRSRLTESHHTLGCRIGIRRRGETSLRSTDQKPNLAVECWASGTDEDLNISPLGLPSESDWVLWAPWNLDPSGLRNAFIFFMGRQTGQYAVRTRFVEVFLNVSGGDVSAGHYAGFYILMEKIKRDKNRVDVESMGSFDIQEPNVSGGYLLRIDKANDDLWLSNNGVLQWDLWGSYPPDMNVYQKNYIQNYIKSFEAQLLNPDPETGYPLYINEASFIDFHMMNLLAQNADGLRLSTYLYKPRNGKLAMGPLWDFDRSMQSRDDRDDNPVSWVGTRDSTPVFDYSWWDKLFKNADFWQAYIDRWQALRSGDMNDSAVAGILDSMAAEIAEARERDIARWNGVNPRRADEGGHGLDGTQQGEVSHLKWWLTTRMNWIDTHFYASPVLSVSGGPISEAISLSLTSPSGKPIYYTLDGSDPRNQGGSLSATSIRYTSPFQVPPDSVVKARVWDETVWSGSAPDDAPWSGLTQAVYPSADLPLRVTELHYNPLPDSVGSLDKDRFEFIEFRNTGTHLLDLRGYGLRGGIEFDFAGSNVESLAPDARVVIVSDLGAFQSRYPGSDIPVAGVYSGNLSNSGESLQVEFHGRTVYKIHYADDREWPIAADGGGHSLVSENDSSATSEPLSWQYPEHWRASAYIGGSPGEKDPLLLQQDCVINELIAHTDTGQAPPFDSNDLIELYNPNDFPVVLDGHWYLSDDINNPESWQIPGGSVLPAKGHIAFDESDFHPDRINGFGLDKAGEQIILSHRPGGGGNRIVDAISFLAQANGSSWGRFPDGDANWLTTIPTPGTHNQVEQPSVRFQQLMFNPAADEGSIDAAELEYVQVMNRSAVPVQLSGGDDTAALWRIQGGIEFEFQADEILDPGESLYVVSFDPEENQAAVTNFLARYSLQAGDVRLAGPFSGRLDNQGERLMLLRPQAADPPDSGEVSWIVVDEICWRGYAPWPQGIDVVWKRIGWSGGDPSSWAVNDTELANRIHQTPRAWLLSYHLPDSDAGALADTDGDGEANWKEYKAGTPPLDARGFLYASSCLMTGTGVEVSWQAVLGKSYRLEGKFTLDDPAWIPLQTGIPATLPETTVEVPWTNSSGFFRVEVE